MTAKTHELKILPRNFCLWAAGLKTSEIRRNDRDFKSGDMILLKECAQLHDEEKGLIQSYTGKQIGPLKICYVDHKKSNATPPGYVTLYFEECRQLSHRILGLSIEDRCNHLSMMQGGMLK